MTIRFRLALLFTLAVLVLELGATAVFVDRLRSDLEQSLDNTLIARAQAIIAELGPSTSDVAAGVVGRVRVPPANGVYAQLLAPDAAVLTSSRGLRTPLLPPALAHRAAARPVSLDRQVSVASPGPVDRERMRVLAMPTGHPGVLVAVAVSREVVDRAISRATEQLLILCLGALLVAGPGAWLIARFSLRPVERMRLQVAQMHIDQIGDGVSIPRGRDEITRLGRTFNTLLDRLHQYVQRERAFVADAGHELRTPLTVLKGELELAERPGRTMTELRNTIVIAAEETDRLVELAEDLLTLASGESASAPTVTFDLTAVAAQSIQTASAIAAERRVDLRVEGPSPAVVRGDPHQIRRVIDNLLANAIRFAPAGTPVVVTIERHGEDVQLTVRDHGPGFPPGFLPVAFQRFTRATEPVQQPPGVQPPDGNGLGLAIVQSVLLGHGGTATAANHPAGGAVVTIRWPANAKRGTPRLTDD